jgi:hypothetical protein|tara:strand:+ start:9427 stop:10500 length:1074 start_codon:yes stop_codon:yes gene_type:complete
MKELFKTFLYNFFVLFFIHLFLFSTNEAYANTYKIENIEVSNEYNTNFSKEDVIDKAFINAYQILINKLTISKDHKSLKQQNLKMIKSFVESFSIVDEKFENNKYFGTFEINFNKMKILSFLRNKNIFHSRMVEKGVLFIPVYINLDEDSLLLFDENPFYKNWNYENENHFLLKYILQSEDLEDYKLIKDRITFIEDYDFNEIISKYEINKNFIIFIIFQDKKNFKTFSKFNVNAIKSNFKLEFGKFDFNDEDKIKQLIKSMKIRYDDEWKKINLINSSIKLNIQLNLNSKNIIFMEKIEKILSEIELIEKYYISFFDNEITRFSILSNSTPDKLIKEFEKFNIKISIENNVWTLNE